MSLGTLRQRPIRRRWIFGAVTAALIATVALLVSAAGGTLPTGSTFDAFNGSLTSTTKHDWNPAGSPAGNLGPVDPINCGTTIPTPSPVPASVKNCGLDLTGKATDANGNGDNALGQGTKEDDTNATVVNGSIPPNKDDLSRFYINSEKKPCVASATVNCDGSTTHQFLYMAWERTNVLGSAHMDFEFNQQAVGLTATSTGAVTLNRQLGDILIDFDFGGSGVPTLALHRWINTSTPSTDCEAVSSGTNVFCWSKGVDLSSSCTPAPATACAEASVNGADVIDYNPPGAPRTLPGTTVTKSNNTTVSSTFGEAAIDLTAANVFPANKCFHLGDAWLKSRSAGSSFNSELKDFIAPIPINISNCGEIKIIKRTNPRGVDQDFGFTSDIPNPTGTVTVDSQPYCQADTSPSAFTLNDKDGATGDTANNTEDCVNVLSSDPATGNLITYHVTESTPLPAGFTLDSLTCTVFPANGTSTGAQDGTDPYKANITVQPGETVTCVYVDKQQLGAIKVTKSYKHAADGSGDHPQSGVSFTVNGVTKSTDSNGVACFDGLSFATYTVHETVPSGYHVDANDKSVTVDNNAKCSDASYIGETVSFHNTPLTNLTVTAASVVSGGTLSTVTCTTGDHTAFPGTGIGNSPQGPAGTATVTASGTTALEPGTYTCEVVVDP